MARKNYTVEQIIRAHVEGFTASPSSKQSSQIASTRLMLLDEAFSQLESLSRCMRQF